MALNHRLILISLISLLAFSSVSQSHEAPPEKRTVESKILDVGDGITKAVDATADAIDLTLAGKKYVKKRNTSSANVTQLVTWSEGGVVRKSTDFGLNLKLPNVERRWQLRFSSYDEDKENRNLTQLRVRTRPRERDFGAGMMFFQKLGRVRTLFQPRLQLKSPLEMAYVLRFESDAELKPFHFTPRLDLYADPKKGTGEFVSFEFRSEVSKRMEIDLRNTEEYRDKDNFFTTQNGVSLEYSLTDTQATGAGLSCESQNRPSFHMSSVTASTVYSQVIYKERLNYSVTPFLGFAKSDNFKGKAGITLNLDLVF